MKIGNPARKLLQAGFFIPAKTGNEIEGSGSFEAPAVALTAFGQNPKEQATPRATDSPEQVMNANTRLTEGVGETQAE